MKYRDLTELSNTLLFQNFIKDFNLEYKIINSKLCIRNNCILILIYGFSIEEILYFDFVNISEKTIAHIGKLISQNNKIDDMKRIYAFFKDNHIKPISNVITPTTLNAEIYFMTYIKIVSEYLSDLIRCKLTIYKKCFEPAPLLRQKEFTEILRLW